MTRLEGCTRIANLVRRNIECYGGRYNGSTVPNLQSIIDMATLPDEYLPMPQTELELEKIEKHFEKSKKPLFTKAFG